MKLHKLHLVNFMSHADSVIEFSRGLTMITGQNLDYVHGERSIGAGKSSILAGISWALWGRVPRKCVKNEVISNGADGCVVELELHDNKDSLSITRSKSVKRGREGGGDLEWASHTRTRARKPRTDLRNIL